MKINKLLIALLIAISAISTPAISGGKLELLNVSYDPTREFYEKYNSIFAEHWKEKNGTDISIKQSHGGSGKQARSVIDGLKADVVTLALAYDIDAIAEKGKLLPEDWQTKFPHNSAPFNSVIVFLVHKENPKHIKDWADLVRNDVQVITPNPKTSGGARWNYLAAWGYANRQYVGNDAKIKEYMTNLFKNVPVLDSGARGATTTFIQREIGDVLITWENEAILAIQQGGADKFSIVYPTLSIVAETPVAVVEKNASAKGTLDAATEYLNFLYSEKAQELAAKYFYRPTDSSVLARYSRQFPKLSTITIDDFGGWKKAQKDHFDDGGSFDQIYGAK